MRKPKKERRVKWTIKNKSDWVRVTSGVSQRSFLGPLLFNIYIDDLDCGIRDINKFANDTKIGRLIRSGNDAVVVQKEITGLHEWAKKLMIPFNIDKFSKYIPLRNYVLNDADLGQSN